MPKNFDAAMPFAKPALASAVPARLSEDASEWVAGRMDRGHSVRESGDAAAAIAAVSGKVLPLTAAMAAFGLARDATSCADV